jgi:hypothetical protein
MPKRTRNQGQRRQQSLGELISTLVFIGMSVWLFLEGLSLMGQAPNLQIAGLFFTSFLSFLGALRLVIAKAWSQLRKGDGE